LEFATIGSGYPAEKTTTTHRLRINVPQDFHAPYTEDKENLSRQQPGSRYSIVKEGNAPFGWLDYTHAPPADQATVQSVATANNLSMTP
jgi:hypothetical protein